MRGGGKWAIDPGLLLAAFVGFYERYPSLTRVALWARRPVCSKYDVKPAAALRAAIRHCIGARDASGIWVEQVLDVLLYAARNMPPAEERWRLTGWDGPPGEARPRYKESPVAACLELLLLYAFQESQPES